MIETHLKNTQGFNSFTELCRKIKSGDTGKLSEPRIEWTQMIRNPKFKGHELIRGDVIDFDGILFIVQKPITDTALGRMKQLAGTRVRHLYLIQRVLCKLGFIAPKYWRETMNIYTNNNYDVVGNGAENVN